MDDFISWEWLPVWAVTVVCIAIVATVAHVCVTLLHTLEAAFEGLPSNCVAVTNRGITNGMAWQQAGHLASHAAARIVSQMGARLEHKFTPEEVAEFCSMS